MVLRLVSLAVIFTLSACAQSELTAARTRLRAGDYVGAHRELVALAAHQEKLKPAERREVKDDLCATDFAIGRPTFSFKEQQRVCVDAASEPGTQSTDVLTRVYAASEQADDEQIDAAIKSGDLAAGEAAVQDYE